MKKLHPSPGQIFCIPLFMPKDDWKLTKKLSDNDLDKDFAFGRVIETSSSVLVEVFKKIGSAKTNINEIVGSGVMFSPLQIFWDSVVKKRWRVISVNAEYDKLRDSNYANLKMAFGSGEEFRLRQLNTKKEVPISREALHGYEFSVVWFPIDLENRIIETIMGCSDIVGKRGHQSSD
jgi:hypothetical protein